MDLIKNCPSNITSISLDVFTMLISSDTLREVKSIQIIPLEDGAIQLQALVKIYNNTDWIFIKDITYCPHQIEFIADILIDIHLKYQPTDAIDMNEWKEEIALLSINKNFYLSLYRIGK